MVKESPAKSSGTPPPSVGSCGGFTQVAPLPDGARPHVVNLPRANATLHVSPAAIDRTRPSACGTLHCPSLFLPHATSGFGHCALATAETASAAPAEKRSTPKSTRKPASRVWNTRELLSPESQGTQVTAQARAKAAFSQNDAKTRPRSRTRAKYRTHAEGYTRRALRSKRIRCSSTHRPRPRALTSSRTERPCP